jgi:hypothetical protein
MAASIACLLLVRRPNDYRVWLAIFGIAALITLAQIYGRFLRQRVDGIRGRNWPTVSALIDVVSVVEETEQTRYGERTVGYTATLTYFYRNPELQMGEYRRMFDKEGEAQTWAHSRKGSNVLVHVDPRDPAHSALREEDF